MALQSTLYFTLAAILCTSVHAGSFAAPECKYSSTPYYIADPADCSKYFICYRGLGSHESCPAGKFWNEQTEKCVNEAEIPADSKCLSGPGTTSTTVAASTGKPVEPTPSTVSTTSPIPTSTPAPPEDAQLCIGFPGTYTYYPGDCSKFVICEGGEAFQYACPPSMAFDDTTNQCRLTSEVDLEALKCREALPSKETCVSATPGRTRFPDPFSCQRYYECADFVDDPKLVECGQVLMFDPPTGNCVRSEELSETSDVGASRCYQPVPRNFRNWSHILFV